MASRHKHQTDVMVDGAGSAVDDDGRQEIEKWIGRNTFRVDDADYSCRMKSDTRASAARCPLRSQGRRVVAMASASRIIYH